jgi:hypothetical protein
MKNFALLFLFSSMLLCSSCKKSDLKTTTHSYLGWEGSGVTGTMTVEENSDKQTIDISVSLAGLISGKKYNMHIHSGPFDKAASILYAYDQFTPSTTYSKCITYNMTYAEYLTWDASFIIHNPDDASKYVLKGNMGVNAK